MGFAAHLATVDRAVLMHLGGAVTYTAGSGEAVIVRGVFDSAYVRMDAGQPGVSTSGPAVFLTLADLPSDPETDDPALMIDGSQYRAHEVKKDGKGGVLILLHEVG